MAEDRNVGAGGQGPKVGVGLEGNSQFPIPTPLKLETISRRKFLITTYVGGLFEILKTFATFIFGTYLMLGTSN